MIPKLVERYPDARFLYKPVGSDLEVQNEYFKEYVSLHYENQKGQRREYAGEIQEILNLNSKYVVLNVPWIGEDNAKRYYRRISHFQKINPLIDRLIEKGYTVVHQGRDEQPSFEPRPGFIDLAHSSYRNATYDLQLYAGAEFAILNSTGPEVFSEITATPLFGINQVELSDYSTNCKMRMYPKLLYCNRQKRYLSWEEIIDDPFFYHTEELEPHPDYEYHDMTEKQQIDALEEFLSLVESGKWWDKTVLQAAYADKVRAVAPHIVQSHCLPFDCWLESMSSTNSPLVESSCSNTSETVPT